MRRGRDGGVGVEAVTRATTAQRLAAKQRANRKQRAAIQALRPLMAAKGWRLSGNGYWVPMNTGQRDAPRVSRNSGEVGA